MFRDLKEVSLFDQRVMGLKAPHCTSVVVGEVFIQSSFLCKNSSLAASSFSGFGPEDREALVLVDLNLVP